MFAKLELVTPLTRRLIPHVAVRRTNCQPRSKTFYFSWDFQYHYISLLKKNAIMILFKRLTKSK